jgi:hypothetical protein
MADFQDLSGKPLIGSKPVEGPIIRLLVCLVCETIEELPDYDGPTNHDYLLEISLEKHTFPSGDPHVGKLFKIPVKSWANEEQKKAVLEQLRKGGSSGLDDLTEEKNFYETKMTFAQDAMECWQKHNKPKDNCDDYQTPSKRLLPDTAKERGELGLPKPEHLEGPKIYTCNFCPYHGEVVQRKRRILGMYNK